MDIVLNAREGSSAASEFGETLVEAGAPDAIDWTDHKAASDALLRAVRGALGHRYGVSLSLCSSELLLERHDQELKVRPFSSCRKRWCPVCEWRKSRRRWRRVVERLPELLAQQPPLRWVMLTLTVRNCALDELRDTVKGMLEAWRRLTRRNTWPALGWIRAVEITFPRPGEAHPHIHALLAVRPSYFGKNYITQAEWKRLWRECARLDYDPVVDVRRVRALQAEGLSEQAREALGGLSEVAKYCTKPADLAQHPEEAVAGLSALRHVRLLDAGGFLRGIFAEAEEDDAEEEGEVERVAVFWWRAVEMQYRRKLGA